MSCILVKFLWVLPVKPPMFLKDPNVRLVLVVSSNQKQSKVLLHMKEVWVVLSSLSDHSTVSQCPRYKIYNVNLRTEFPKFGRQLYQVQGTIYD